ncbi:MAG: PTS sugar transporter subunit IIC [Bacteroidaceae bacterium]|nr:PTS sugar transporter subunit IIC [Bacteroidaceae bacterium]
MEQVFAYIIQLGASVMMPILFTIIGLCIGMKFGKSLKSGLYVGVGFVGLGIVTALLTTNFKTPLGSIAEIFQLNLKVFDMGWPAAAAVAYNTAVGALIIPICLGINFLLLVTKCTRTVNIDLWNYWHFAFIGAVAYFVMDQSLLWGYFAAISCYIITLVMADLTADRFQGYYDNMEGISIPQPFCQSFTPFAMVINWLLDRIPGFSNLDIDAEGLKKKFGVLGEPIVLGVIVGALIGVAAHYGDFADLEAYRLKLEAALQETNPQGTVSMTDVWVKYILKDILFLGVTMGAVMELIPRITRLFIDGLMPISEKTQEVVKRKFKGKKIYIGMSPALVIGHPTTLVVSLLLIPVTLVLAIALSKAGNQFLPLASLAGMFYVFVMVLPFTKGNVLKTFIIGLVTVTIGLYFVTDMAPAFTLAANTVFEATQDKAAQIPEGFQAGAMDFASSLFGYVIYACVKYLKWIGMGVLTLITVVMMVWNRMRIVKEEKLSK